MSDSRLLALGDVHGCLRALETLAAFVPLRPADTLVALGDYVDRGDDSAGVLDWMIDWNERGRLVPLLGNHDRMMQRARTSRRDHRMWLSFGGQETLCSYPSAAPTLRDVPAEHWHFLDATCRAWHETDAHLFVHASVDPRAPMAAQSEAMLFWEKLVDRGPHASGKRVVCGHTSQKSGLPLDLGHTVCIDTRVYDDGWLTCLDVATDAFWQANERGETRRGRLAGLR